MESRKRKGETKTRERRCGNWRRQRSSACFFALRVYCLSLVAFICFNTLHFFAILIGFHVLQSFHASLHAFSWVWMLAWNHLYWVQFFFFFFYGAYCCFWIFWSFFSSLFYFGFWTWIASGYLSTWNDESK